ncbi:MAG: hypothetical protein HC802_03390 [Caldilineaceae bacterium]|nr:hypothetical protein [Caldilineaceae bacterium]
MKRSLFERYPLAAQPVQTSAGDQPTPYHVYDGHLMMIGGSADLDAVSRLLAGEQIYPAKTESGRALMAMYVADETEASHGPHTELQFSFYVSHQPTAPVKDGPFAPVHFLVSDPDARQMCFGLWNDTEKTVAYNREVLGLTPELATSTFARQAGQVDFTFHDVEGGALLASGSIHEAARQPLNAVGSLFRSFGVRQALAAASMKEVAVKVVNPINDLLPRNADAQTISASDVIITQHFDPARDKIEIAADSVYSQLDFRPTFVQHMRNFKMVYLNPQ